MAGIAEPSVIADLLLERRAVRPVEQVPQHLPQRRGIGTVGPAAADLRVVVEDLLGLQSDQAAAQSGETRQEPAIVADETAIRTEQADAYVQALDRVAKLRLGGDKRAIELRRQRQSPLARAAERPYGAGERQRQRQTHKIHQPRLARLQRRQLDRGTPGAAGEANGVAIGSERGRRPFRREVAERQQGFIRTPCIFIDQAEAQRQIGRNQVARQVVDRDHQRNPSAHPPCRRP
jgi:hypothetical protein